MRKFLITALMLVLSVLNVFAQYEPILHKYSKTYKNEINRVIKKQVPVAKKEIKYIFEEIDLEENSSIRECLIEKGTDDVLFQFYMKLVDVTDKYANVRTRQFMPYIDGYKTLKEIIDPYLEDNDANISKVNSLLKFAEKKQRELDKKRRFVWLKNNS